MSAILPPGKPQLSWIDVFSFLQPYKINRSQHPVVIVERSIP